MKQERIISLPEALVLAAALLFMAFYLARWQTIDEECSGQVVKNAWGWPTCVAAPAEEDRP